MLCCSQKIRLQYWLMVLCCFLSAHLYAQSTNSDRNLFAKPMQLPFNLAGSFGEPRPNHFHAGIDIKTNGMEGESVYSIYDGYISRIKVSSVGYGKAIYITHTNGYTSVYGHLSKFNDQLEKYVHQQHYIQKKSELDLFIDVGKFIVKKNDLIAYSGNTGGSSAPHLHFEIRNTKTEEALNPLDFYSREYYSDTIPPQVNQVKIYPFDQSFYYYNAGITVPLIKQENYYTTMLPIQFGNHTDFCISLEGFDKPDTSSSKNGIDKIEVFQNQQKVFSYHMNVIDFNRTRMCNAFIDYDEMKRDNGYFYNLYRLKNNTYPIYNSTNNGFFKINHLDTIPINLFCYDYNNNKTEVRLQIIRNDSLEIKDSVIAVTADEYAFKNIASTQKDSLQLDNFKINFSANALYDDISLSLTKTNTTNKYNSPIFKVDNLDNYIPLQSAATISLKTNTIKNPDKIVWIHQSLSGKETALQTRYANQVFSASAKELGQFYLQYDTIKPEIKLLSLKDKISVQITDDLSGILNYNGYIDNKWVNFYYDAKNNSLEYIYDEYCPRGEHTLKIIVTDNKGNKNTLIQKFIYSS